MDLDLQVNKLYIESTNDCWQPITTTDCYNTIDTKKIIDTNALELYDKKIKEYIDEKLKQNKYNGKYKLVFGEDK